MKDMENRQHKKIKFLTVKEASQILGIPLSTLYRLSRNGSIKSMHIGNRWYYPESEINKHLQCYPSNVPRVSEQPERRAYPRVNCNIECCYSIELKEKDEVFRGVIKNISGGGLLLQDEYNISNVKLEDPVKLNFILNVDDVGETIIKTRGRVVRKIISGCGIKFRNINKDYENLVIQFVG